MLQKAAAIMPVISEPLKELVGQGSNNGAVRDCRELYLGKRGIEKVAGFERLVNLEVLWLNNNQLQAITGLETNIRIKQLYVHNNSICTLKGSLPNLKALTHLDISHNQLQNLSKVIKALTKFPFLTDLTLLGNPCCEEPSYRLKVLHELPDLQVFDHHQVTTAELTDAARVIGHDTTLTSVAFGGRVPYAFKTQEQGPQCADISAGSSTMKNSVLEQELQLLAHSIRVKQEKDKQAAHATLYLNNPDAEYWAPKASLPPSPGLLLAQQAWAANSMPAGSSSRPACALQEIQICPPVHLKVPWTKQDGQTNTASNTARSPNSLNNTWHGAQVSAAQCADIGPSQAAAACGSYMPKDVYILQCNSSIRHKKADGRPLCDPALQAGACTGEESLQEVFQPRYMQGTFGHRLAGKSWTTESLQLKL